MDLNSTLAGLHFTLDTMNFYFNGSDFYKGGGLERGNFRIQSFATSNEELDVECVYFSDEQVEYTDEADITEEIYLARVKAASFAIKSGFTFALLLLLFLGFVAIGLRISGYLCAHLVLGCKRCMTRNCGYLQTARKIPTAPPLPPPRSLPAASIGTTIRYRTVENPLIRRRAKTVKD